MVSESESGDVNGLLTMVMIHCIVGDIGDELNFVPKPELSMLPCSVNSVSLWVSTAETSVCVG